MDKEGLFLGWLVKGDKDRFLPLLDDKAFDFLSDSDIESFTWKAGGGVCFRGQVEIEELTR